MKDLLLALGDCRLLSPVRVVYDTLSDFSMKTANLEDDRVYPKFLVNGSLHPYLKINALMLLIASYWPFRTERLGEMLCSILLFSRMLEIHRLATRDK